MCFELALTEKKQDCKNNLKGCAEKNQKKKTEKAKNKKNKKSQKQIKIL